MKLQFVFLAAFFLPALTIFAQPTSKGLPKGVTDATLIDQLMKPLGSNVRDLLEQRNLKPYMMPVRDAGNKGNEQAYIVASALEYYVNLNRNYKENLSPDYISLSLNVAGKQPTIEENLLFLTQNGTVSAAIMPYGATTITGAVFATPKIKIENYLYLFRDLTKDSQRVFETKKALMRGHPVIAEFKADESLRNLKNTRQWSPEGGNQQDYTLMVVGFDETQDAFEVLSCWGADWGLNGYAWIRYNDFGKYAVNGYVIVPQGK